MSKLKLASPTRPVQGARKFALRGAEYARSAVSGVTVAAVIGLLQLIVAHLSDLPIDPDTATLVSGLLGGVIALIQLCMQFFQHDDSDDPPPPPPLPK